MSLSTATPLPAPAAPAVDLADVRKRLQANARALGAVFYERGDIIGALNVAAVSREHVLLVGPPGTAKSDLARSWAAQFSDGVYRENLFTKQSTEADHLAFLDVKEFTEGRYVYRYDGKMTQGHIAFGDEIFKGTGGFVNSLLGWLNERVVRGGFVSPLVTFVGASNEFGEDDTVAALEDRLLIRFWVDPIQDKAARLAFLGGSAEARAPLAPAAVLIQELHAAHEAARALPCDPLVFDGLVTVQDALKGAGIYVSDRRMAKCVRILQAVAWLDGSDQVEIDHIDFLQQVLWRRPEDQPTVRTALGLVNKGVLGEIRTIVDAALSVYNAAAAGGQFEQRALSLSQVLKDAGEEIKVRFKGKIPDRVRERANGYLSELHEAYKHCIATAKNSGLTV